MLEPPTVVNVDDVIATQTRASTAYQLFTNDPEVRGRLVKGKMTLGEISKTLSSTWKTLSDAEKQKCASNRLVMSRKTVLQWWGTLPAIRSPCTPPMLGCSETFPVHGVLTAGATGTRRGLKLQRRSSRPCMASQRKQRKSLPMHTRCLSRRTLPLRRGTRMILRLPS